MEYITIEYFGQYRVRPYVERDIDLTADNGFAPEQGVAQHTKLSDERRQMYKEARDQLRKQRGWPIED